MRTVEISLLGADSASHARLGKKETRVLPFDDGIERSITYPKRIWNILDDLTIGRGTPESEWLKAALEFADQAQNRSNPKAFEKQVREELKMLLLASLYDDQRNGKSTANDFDINKLLDRVRGDFSSR